MTQLTLAEDKLPVFDACFLEIECIVSCVLIKCSRGKLLLDGEPVSYQTSMSQQAVDVVNISWVETSCF